MIPTYYYGHVPDPVGHMVTGAHRLLGKIGSLPRRASLREHAIIGDQATTSSCVGWAVSQGVYVSLKTAGMMLPAFPSPHGIYTLARAVDRLSEKIPLDDGGSMPNQAMRSITEWGIPLSTDWPFDPNAINAEPDLGELMEASRLKLLGYYRIDDDDTVVDRIKQAIVSGYAIPLATRVDQAFEDYDGYGTIAAPSGDLGGHYICAIGYDTLSSGRAIIEIANSWGTGWGDGGFARCEESWVIQTIDRYVMNLHRAH